MREKVMKCNDDLIFHFVMQFQYSLGGLGGLSFRVYDSLSLPFNTLVSLKQNVKMSAEEIKWDN